MMQYIGFSSGLCGPGLLSTLPERSSMFELSQLTATKLPSATIIASKRVDGWVTIIASKRVDGWITAD